MDNNERILKIKTLQEEINPLNYKRIFLETSLKLAEENFIKDFGGDKEEIIKIQNELKDLYNDLNPIFEELRKLQCKYLIEYEGQIFDPISNMYRWNNEYDVFNLTNCCEIDTFKNNWNDYVSIECVHKLIVEINEVIYRLKYSNFNIKNVRKID